MGKVSPFMTNLFLLQSKITMYLYPRLCLVNASDRYYTIRKDTVVGEAVSADPVELYQKAQQDGDADSNIEGSIAPVSNIFCK
jgi:hypothetical protein